MFSKIAIIICTPDLAAMNVKQQLLTQYHWKVSGTFEKHPVHTLENNARQVSIYTTDTECIHCEHLDEQIDADFFIFATKHVSKSGIPSLTVHTQGNFGKAEFGGEDRVLAKGSGTFLGNALLKLMEERDKRGLKIDVIQEATHHGPCLNKPSMFIEIGSSEKEWNNPTLGEVNAAVVHGLVTSALESFPCALGIGGQHHCPEFTKVFLKEKIAFIHVCPKYMLASVDQVMILQALEKSVEPIRFVYLDWKGLGAEKERMRSLVEHVCKEKNIELRRC